MLVKVSGTIEELGTPQQITDKMRKRDVVIKTAGQYPDYVKCEAVNERITQTEKLRVGDYVTLNCALNGRKVTKKDTGAIMYFTSVKILTVENESIGENSLRNLIEETPF